MPEMDGVETLQHIREMGGKYEKLPIIALTANALVESRDLLISSGMNDFLAKPIDKPELMRILQKWLPPEKISMSEMPAKTGQGGAYSEVLASAAKIDGLNIELALGRMGGMQETLEKSLRQTAFAIESRLEKMNAFLSDGKLHDFVIIAHGMKSMFANIGASRNSELAAELETASKAEDAQLCAEKFPEFADISASFAKKLQAIFPESPVESKPKGDSEALARGIGEVIGCLDNFEVGDAIKLITGLDEFTYGADTDALLREAKSRIESFNYEKSVQILKSIDVNRQF